MYATTDILFYLLQAVDVRQIYDKFPEKKGGLKELYDKGPQNAFFLVKFWADLNSNIEDEAGAFYGVASQYVYFNISWKCIIMIPILYRPIFRLIGNFNLKSNAMKLCNISHN